MNEIIHLHILEWNNAGLLHYLDKCTLQDKKKALNALDVQIVAMPEEMKIRIAVSLEFITIEQTSASMFRCRYSYVEGKGYKLAYI